MSMDAGSVLAHMDLDISPFQRNLEQAVREIQGFLDTSNTVEDRLNSLGNTMGTVGSAVTKNISVPLAGLATTALKFFGDFEEGINKISTLDTDNILNIDGLKSELLTLSDDVGENASELAEATYQMGSAMGAVSEDVVQYTGIASKAAIGGFSDTTTAVDGLSTAMNIYGDKSTQTMQLYSDLMLNAQNKGKTTFGEMAGTMGDLLPIMAQLDMGMEDYTTSMAVLTKNGLATNKATTGLKAALSNIIKPTSEAAEAAEALGLNFSAAEIQSKGFSNFIAEIKEKVAGAIPEYTALIDKQVDLQTQLAELENSGSKNTDAYKALKSELAETEKSMETMATAAESPIQGFAQLFGSVEGLNSMMILSSEQGMKDYNDILASTANVAGLTEQAYEKMNQGVKDTWEDTWVQAKNTLIRFGDFVAPYVSTIFNGIGSALTYLSSLNDDTKKLIVTAGMFVTAAGPLLMVGGKLIKGMVTISTLAGTVSQAVALASGAAIVPTSGAVSTLAGAFTALTGPVGLAVLGIGAVAAAGYAFYKNMSQEVLPQVDLFADEVIYASDGTKVLEQSISETTKNSVQAYMDLEKGALESLSRLSVEGTVITAEQSTEIQGQYNAMKDTVIRAMEERHTAEMDTLKKNFSESNALSEEQEAELLQKLNDKQWEEKAAVMDHYAEINAIVAKAKAEERELTLEEVQQIKAIQEEQKANAINVLSQSEVEARVILDRMKNYNGTVSAEIASKTIQDAENARLATVATANQKCDEETAIAIRMRDELGIITDEECQNMIDDATRKKDETIKEAEAMKEATVEAMVSQNANLEESVDLSTGEILTKYEVFKNNASKKWEEIRANTSETNRLTAESAVEVFTGLGEDISSLLGAIVDFFKDCWNDITGIVSSAGNLIKTLWDETSKNVTSISKAMVDGSKKAFTDFVSGVKAKSAEIVTNVKTFVTDGVAELKKMPSEFKQAAIDTVNGFINGFNTKVGEALQNVSQFGSDLIAKFKNVLGIQSPSKQFYAIGEFVNAGLANGITDSSSNPANAMIDVAKKILSTGNEISTGLIEVNEETGQVIYNQMFNSLMDKTSLFFEERDKRIDCITEGTDETMAQLQREIEATEDAYDVKMKLYEQEMYAKLALIDDSSNDDVKELKKRIQAISDLNEAEQKEEAARKYEEQLQEKQNALRSAKTAEDKDKILKQITQLKQNREKELLRQSRKEEQDALRDEIQEIQQKAAEDKAAIKETYEAKKYQLDQQKLYETAYLKTMQEVLKKDSEDRKKLEEVQTQLKNVENKKRTAEETAELKARETELKASMENNRLTLEGFTPVVKKMGDEYGDALLSGFSSTETELNSYLMSLAEKAKAVAKAVRDAEKGKSSSARAAIDMIGEGSYSAERASQHSLMSLARSNQISMQLSDEYTHSALGVYEESRQKQKTELEIDYDKLGRAIAQNTKPNITMNNEFTSPKALSESEIKRNQELMLRNLNFQFC